MTKRLIKTRKDHRKVRALIEENTVTQTMTPAAGALAGGTVGTAHAGVTFALSAPVGTSSFVVASGSLPTGMSLDGETGVLSGTPTAAATYSFTIKGSDSFGNSAANAYTLTVAAA